VIGDSDVEDQEHVTSLLSKVYGCNETIDNSYISEVEVGSKGDKEEFHKQITKLSSSLAVENQFLEISKLMFDIYNSTSPEDIEQVGIGIIENFSCSSLNSPYHEQELGIIHGAEDSHGQSIHLEQQAKVTSYCQNSISFILYDLVDIYMEEFIGSKFPSLVSL
jgi:hypothetical protein